MATSADQEVDGSHHHLIAAGPVHPGRPLLAEAPTTLRSGGSEILLIEAGPPAVDAALVARWLRSGCAGPAPVRQGFAAVLVDERDGGVTAATSSRLEIALYFTRVEGRLICSTRLPRLLAELPEAPELEVAKLADLMALHDDPATTVYAGIGRLPIGHVLRWRPGQEPSVARWFRPEPVEPRRLAPGEEVELMRVAVRDAVAASLPAGGDVAATLSGGLDSSMVVATAASLLEPAGRIVHTATAVPLAGTADPSERWHADDGPYARAMAQEVAGLTWTAIVNETRATPVEALTATFRRTYAPSLNSANVVWISAMLAWAEALGVPLLLTGATGNAPFSRGRSGVLRELIRAGAWAAVVRQVRARHHADGSWRRALRALGGELAPPPLRHLALGRRARGRADDLSFGEVMPLRPEALSAAARDRLARLDARRVPRRDDWVRFVLRDGSLSTTTQAMSERVWWSDPLSDPEVVSLALSLPPEAWIRDGQDRSLARRSAAGLVPDDIRLRTTRGAQAADVGRWMEGSEERYREAMDIVAASPAAQQFIEIDALTASIAHGLPSGADAIAWDNTHGRALGFGLFAAWYENEVLAQPATEPSARSMAAATSATDSTPDGRTTSTRGTADAS